MIDRLDRLFCWIRSQPFFLRFTLFTRILLAAGFIPTGMVKLLGQRFTTVPMETPIGAFFEAMYQTGLYWRFLGAGQVVAGLLLLFPRLAHLGALIFLPIMLNIFVVTVSLDFTGTPVVTGLMLLAVIWLCAWDYHRIRGLLTDRPWSQELPVPTLRLDWLERIGFAAFALSLIGVFGTTRGMVLTGVTLGLVVSGALAGLLTLLRFLFVGRRLRA